MGVYFMSQKKAVIALSLILFNCLYANDAVKGLEVIDPIVEKISEGVGKGIATGVADGIEKGAGGIVTGASKAFEEEFSQEGHAYGGVRNVFRSIGDQFKKEGEGRKAVDSALGAVADSFDEGSQGRRAAVNAAETTNTYVDSVGTSLAKATGKVGASAALTAIFGTLGAATVWYGSKLLWNWIEKKLFKPKILISFSKKGTAQKNAKERKRNKMHEPIMIFDSALQKRLDGIIQTTKVINTKIKEKNTTVKYRNLLLYGPPGTGKTLFAKQLAERSDMAFAMASGASFAKQGALEAMDELFEWANRSKGLMLFIDEAECLLPDRDDLKPDSSAYRVFTNFLNHTGTRSDRFMIVLATNRLGVIDQAMQRRIDDLVELTLPGKEQRSAVLRAYRDIVLADKVHNSAEFIASVYAALSDEKIEQIAVKTTGFSNGDLEGIINTMKTDADSTTDGLLTEQIVNKAVERALDKYAQFNQKQVLSEPMQWDQKTKGIIIALIFSVIVLLFLLLRKK
jgi:AAA+ superfamily predicted ATPase